MSDRYAVVTGTSRGIGAAVASELLARGWDVAGCARGDAAPAVAAHDAYEHARVDLTDPAAVEAWFERLLDGRGARALALVNNAATIEPVGPLADPTIAALRDALTVNVAVPLALTGRALARASSGARVRVVNVSSGAAHRAIAGWAAYCASKAALHMASDVQGVELAATARHAGHDVAVCSFSPGVVATEMQAAIRASDDADFPDVAQFVALNDEGRLLAPEQPASALVDWIETSPPGGHDVVAYTP